MLASYDPQAPEASRLKPANVIRSANWQAAKDRPPPPAPHDFQFILDSNWIPQGFLRYDIRYMPGARHLIFATEAQLELLRTAHILWVDGTFKLVKDPFYQLFTVHVFIYDDQDKAIKQVYITLASPCITIVTSIH